MTETSSVQAEAVEISQPTEEHQWLEQWTHMLIGLSLSLPHLAYSLHTSITFSALVREWCHIAVGTRLSK